MLSRVRFLPPRPGTYNNLRMDRQAPEEQALYEAHPDWFREPSRREHLIAAALFVAFGAFFVGLFWVQRHWWFRWVILGLGVFSVWHGLRHALDARRGARR
jgi:hypothetical protein